MEFEKQKEKLLKSGKHLLDFVVKKDFGMDIIFDVMDDQHIEELKEWLLRTEEFVDTFGLECHKERFNDSRWIINKNERVSVERINNPLSILENINRN